LVTDRQVRRLFALIKTEKNQEIAGVQGRNGRQDGAKLSPSWAVAKRFGSGGARADPPDPFIDVWSDVQKLFEDNAGLRPRRCSSSLQRQNPGRFQDGPGAHRCSGG